MDIDPRFRQSGQKARRRRLLRRISRIGLGLGALTLFGLIAASGWWVLRDRPATMTMQPDRTPPATASGGDDQIVQIDTSATVTPIRTATPFVDIPGDPMILHFGSAAERKTRDLPAPPGMNPARLGPPGPDQLVLLRDNLVVNERRLITALPSSREDFAFFQAQRSRSLDRTPPDFAAPEPAAPAESSGQTTGSGLSGWKAIPGGDAENSPGDSFTQTRIQNTTSVVLVRPEAQRQQIYRDLVLRIEYQRSFADLLGDNGFSAESAAALTDAATAILPDLAEIAPGSILALRIEPRKDDPRLLSLSLYGPGGYIGSLARVGYGQGHLIASADPWIDDDLRRLAAEQEGNGATTAGQQFRLLDAFYSAAIRNGVPTSLVGETIALLSQAYDLEEFAVPGDRMTLLYSRIPGADGAGPAQVLYAGIDGPSGTRSCYVTPVSGAGADTVYSCFREGQQSQAAGHLANGLLTPVGAPISSGFGPRFHPILKAVRLHSGVDYAAPTGTPVHAAATGTVALAGDGDAYGNVVYIDHPNGLQTRYAHLNRIAPGLVAGKPIEAGEVIGEVGTTGRSTGPHLHFETVLAGAAVDPFTLGNAVGLAQSDAVAALTEQIIHIESGGRADAKNPLSTATGLGQFIESTWLRMMRDYRPDLTANMSRDALLALRTDPTLSREAVQNLARENESYLRQRGHQVTAGRLYLAHFLGPQGADRVLSSTPEALIADVMGAAVVGANPFLRNYSVADLTGWADRKMAGARGGAGSAPAVAPVSQAMRDFMAAVDVVLAEANEDDTSKQSAAPG